MIPGSIGQSEPQDSGLVTGATSTADYKSFDLMELEEVKQQL